MEPFPLPESPPWPMFLTAQAQTPNPFLVAQTSFLIFWVWGPCLPLCQFWCLILNPSP